MIAVGSDNKDHVKCGPTVMMRFFQSKREFSKVAASAVNTTKKIQKFLRIYRHLREGAQNKCK